MDITLEEGKKTMASPLSQVHGNTYLLQDSDRFLNLVCVCKLKFCSE